MEQGGEVALLDTRSLLDVARGVIPEAQPVDLYSNMLVRGDGAELTAYVERAIEAIRNAGFTNDGWIVTYGASSDMHAARAAWTSGESAHKGSLQRLQPQIRRRHLHHLR